jgi:PKD repeat protein
VQLFLQNNYIFYNFRINATAMMNNLTSYRLDEKVIRTMLIVATCFLLLMAFRYTNKKPCGAVDFSFRTANKFDLAYTDEKVYFSSEIKYNAESWEWDFGDKTPTDKKSGPYTTHIYKVPGQYTVRLIINGKCQEAKSINVNKRNSQGKKLYVMPQWPQGPTLLAGTTYNFGDATNGATSWRWYLDDDKLMSTQQRFSYTFTDLGSHKVSLVVNDDMENNLAEQPFTINAPAVSALPQPKVNDNPPPVDKTKPITDNPPDADADKPLPPSINDKLKAYVAPTIENETLQNYFLTGSGYEDIKRSVRDKDFSNCEIYFNGSRITDVQLRDNMIYHNKRMGLRGRGDTYGKSIAVTQERVPESEGNYIKRIYIKAELRPVKIAGVGVSDRKYPFPKN